MRKLFKKVRPLIVPVAVSLTVIILFHTVFMLGYVPTGSMEPSLKTGSLILALRPYGELEKGDIIIFKYGDSYLVKRIAAVEGDIVEHNGESKTVPEACFYVLGDNSEHSYDSRYWEYPFVSADDVMAKVILPIP